MMHKAMRSTHGIASRYHALATPPTRAAFMVQSSRMAGIAHTAPDGRRRVCSPAAGRVWPGLRGLAVRLPLVAFPARVAEGVVVFVNARGTRGGAAERQVKEVHPPQGGLRAALGGGPGGGLCGSEDKGLGLGRWGAEGKGQGLGTSVKAVSWQCILRSHWWC